MLTINEAALRAGRNAETVRRWIRSGRLRAAKVGTQHVIDEGDLEALLDNRPVALPPGWETLSDGSRRPDWGELVRDSRRGH
ncbi:MAG TPA: helix-turn-helix domain-containing protein [Solirubrobacteraceae bacterium]|jgi:excisionase family DNA binding protein|nr:helix-turn-helix domain-containing protein [Solirubrobacteraceae bacterium]